MYAIIDIETTGGSARQEKITEIAVYQHDGKEITGEYTTLVNPGRSIPYFITALTGISNEMVEDAPVFHEIAGKVVELTEGRIIVAHNARFDYSFLRQEFSSLGYTFKRSLIDTVTASRKLFPGYGSYSLDNICKELGINIKERHRAAGDALATVRLFELLLMRDAEINDISSSIFSNTRNIKLNPALNISILDKIPEEPGVYYFYDENSQLIYVGKSRNLFRRISTHLSNNATKRSMEMRDRIADIGWECTGSELIALLRESEEIKRNKPLYNRAQRRSGAMWGIFQSNDEHGYINLRAATPGNEEVPLVTYPSRHKARTALTTLVEKYELCQKMCGLYDTQGSCFHYQVGLCRGACTGKEKPEEYNRRAAKAIDEYSLGRRNCLIIDNGRNEEERSVVKIVNGKYTGYGYFCINDLGFGLENVHNCIARRADNKDIQIIIKGYLSRNRVEKIIDF